MYVIESGLVNWLSPRCADLLNAAERAAERARWEGRQMAPQITEIDALVLRENTRSIQVESGGRPVWLEKQGIEIKRDPERTNQVKIRLPAKLAKQKGL